MKAREHTISGTPPVIAVDLGGTQLRVAVVQGSQVLAKVRVLTGESPLPDSIVSRISSGIDQVLEEAEIGIEQVAGLGVGVAGPLDGRTGVVFAPPNLSGWNNVPLRAMLQKYYGNLPILLENDANAAALGEYLFGAGQGCSDMVYLTISTGIGGGVICNGQLLQGISGTAAELGHMTIDRDGPRCNCGNIGCLESIASGIAITHRASEAMKAGTYFENLPAGIQADPAHVDPHAVADAAREGLPAACAIIKEAAEALGIGIVNIIHIFNPERIILGGGLLQIGSLLLDPALQIVRERAMKVPYQAVSIVPAQFGDEAGLIGAGALIYQSPQSAFPTLQERGAPALRDQRKSYEPTTMFHNL